MALTAAASLKFEYSPCEEMLTGEVFNRKLALVDNRNFSKPAEEKWVLRQKIEEIASFIFKGIKKILSPFVKPACWLKKELSILGFWLVYSKSVPYSLVREVYLLAIPRVENVKSFSKTALIEDLLGNDDLFKKRACQLSTKLHQTNQAYGGNLALLNTPPTEAEIRKIFQCHLIARHQSNHFLEQASCKLKIPENAELTPQLIDDPVKNILRVDELTLSILKASGIDPNHYIRLLCCFFSVHIQANHQQSICPFSSIYTQIQGCLDLHHLCEHRLITLEQTLDDSSCSWLCDAVALSETPLSTIQEADPTNILSEALPVIPSPSYSAIGYLVNRIFKEMVNIYDSMTLAFPCKRWSNEVTSWSIRLGNFVNSFFELDREQGQRQFFQNYILSASSRVPELLNPKWMKEAEKHFEAWQSLSHLLVSYQKISSSFAEKNSYLNYEDFLFSFIVYNFCEYRYHKGLGKAQHLLEKHISQDQITENWLQNTIRSRLHFCDAHTLRMLHRLQKKPQALAEILQAVMYKKIPQEAETFEKHFDCRYTYHRLLSIKVIELGHQPLSA